MLYLRLLGGAALELDGRPVTGPAGRRHPLALLALLATAPATRLSRSKLVGLLWPDSPEATARNRLNTCVYRVRKELGGNALVSVGDDLRLDTGIVDCDAYRFEEAVRSGDLEGAVVLYKGPFLDGFYLGGNRRAFEESVDHERERLRREYLEALEGLAVAAEEKGEPEKAAGWWEKRLDQDPYDGRVVHRLMRVLVAAGNPAAAVRVAGLHARLLEEELGTEPSPEVRGLLEKLTESSVAAGRVDRGEGGLEPIVGREAGASPIREAGTGGDASPGFERPSPPTALGSRARPLRTSPLLAALAAAGLLGGTAIGTWYLVGAVRMHDSPRPDLSLAVLPFDVAGGDDVALLAHGLYSGLLTRLTGISDLTVVSQTSARRLAEEGERLPRAAEDLGVGWIVGADVQRAGDQVRVNARLVDVIEDRQVWAQSYLAELNAGNVFELQSEIAGSIAEALATRLTTGERRRIASVPTENTAAYELYLQAQILREMRDPTGERLDRRIALYRRATELDPEFPEAWVGLAHGYVGHIWTGGDPEVWGDSALAAVRRSLELNPGLAGGYTQLGNVLWALGRGTEEATAAYRRALELEPSSYDAANNLVQMLWFQGDLVELMAWLDRLHRLAPDNERLIGRLVLHNARLGRDEVADWWLEYARRGGHPLLEQEFMVHLFHRGNVDRARELLQELSEQGSGAVDDRLQAALHLYGRDWVQARRSYRAISRDVIGVSETIFGGFLADDLGLAYALDQLGDRDEARALAREVVEASEREFETGIGSPGPLQRMAVAHLILGDTPTALSWLERAVAEGYREVGEMKTAPVLDPLRQHPRFRALVDRMESLVSDARRQIEEAGWGEPPRGPAS